jgi:hypothetical protein
MSDLLEKIEDIVTEMGFRVQKRNGRVSIFFFFISNLSCLVPDLRNHAILTLGCN